MSQGWPAKCTTMIACVLGVIASDSASGSMFNVSCVTSQKTGVAPQCTITLAVEAKVMGEVMTSAPGPTPRLRRARWSAAVQLFVPTAWAQPRYAEKRFSRALVRAPVVSQPERRTASTASSSAAPIVGRQNMRKSGLVILDLPRRCADRHYLHPLQLAPPGLIVSVPTHCALQAFLESNLWSPPEPFSET